MLFGNCPAFLCPDPAKIPWQFYKQLRFLLSAFHLLHFDCYFRAHLLAAETADTLLLVDLCALIAKRDRVCGADLSALRAAGAVFARDAGSAGEHAGEDFRDGRILAAPEGHVLLRRELKVGNHKRLQIAKHV